MPDDLVISADFGTSSVKVALVDPDLRLVAETAQAYPLSLPQPGYAEQNPQDWWDALVRAVADLGQQVPDMKSRVGALVFCSQMGGLVCVGEGDTPLRPCMIVTDKRASLIARNLIGGFPSFEGYRLDKMIRWLRLANGAPGKNGMDPIGKMLWLKENEPAVYDKTKKFLDVKDWLILRATGEYAMTADSANITWLMDTRRGREGWSDPLIRQCGIAAEKLPPIVDGSDIVGTLTATAAAELGLDPGTQMIAGGSDVSLSAIGAGVSDDGELMICASTSSWISGFFDHRLVNISSSYATITSCFDFRPIVVATQECAGSSADWAARVFSDLAPGDNTPPAAFYDATGTADPHDPFFLPWLAGERVPVDDERLRGAFFKLGLGHDKQAIKRAVLEGIAMNTAWAFSKVVREKGVIQNGPVPLVGGMARYPAFVQNLANHLDRPVVTGNPRFAGVLGAAALAAPALGWADSVWDGARQCRKAMTNVFTPIPAGVALASARQSELASARKMLVKLYQKT